jgi:hypothetical protein
VVPSERRLDLLRTKGSITPPPRLLLDPYHLLSTRIEISGALIT